MQSHLDERGKNGTKILKRADNNLKGTIPADKVY